MSYSHVWYLGWNGLKDGFSWNCQSAQLPMASPCDVDFSSHDGLRVVRLLLWWLMAARISVPCQQGGSCIAFITLPPESHAITSPVFYWSKQSQVCPDSRLGRESQGNAGVQIMKARFNTETVKG